MNKEEMLKEALTERKEVYILYNFKIVNTYIEYIALSENYDYACPTLYDTEYGTHTEEQIFLSVEDARLELVKKCKEALEKYDIQKGDK